MAGEERPGKVGSVLAVSDVEQAGLPTPLAVHSRMPFVFPLAFQVTASQFPQRIMLEVVVAS